MNAFISMHTKHTNHRRANAAYTMCQLGGVLSSSTESKAQIAELLPKGSSAVRPHLCYNTWLISLGASLLQDVRSLCILVLGVQGRLAGFLQLCHLLSNGNAPSPCRTNRVFVAVWSLCTGCFSPPSLSWGKANISYRTWAMRGKGVCGWSCAVL